MSLMNHGEPEASAPGEARQEEFEPQMKHR